MATFSPLCSRTIRTATWNGFQRIRHRPHAPTIFIVHHCAGPMQGAINRALNPAKELSWNYAIHESIGEIVGGIPEEYGAWTSSSPTADAIAITVEVGNITGRAPGKQDDHADSWKLSDKTFDALARLIGDWARRYNRPINRQTVIQHREVLSKFGEGVVTACPGGYVRSRWDDLLALANKYKTQGASSGSAGSEEEELMAAIDDIKKMFEEQKSYIDKRTRSAAGSQAQIVKASGHWLDIGIGRCGIWGKDLPFLRSVIVALNWQRRDGAAPGGKSDVAYAKGGPSPFAYEIFEEYRAAAREGGRIHGGPIYERKMRERAAAQKSAGAAGGSASMTAHVDAVLAEVDRLGLSDAEIEEFFEGMEADAPDTAGAAASDADVQEALAGLLAEQE